MIWTIASVLYLVGNKENPQMGTVRHASGAIHFDPPVTAGDLRGDQLRPFTGTNGDRSLVLERTEETVETDEGSVTRIYSAYLIPRWDSDGPDVSYYGNRHIDDHLAELIDALGPGRTYTGQIEVCADIAHAGDFEAYRLTVYPYEADQPGTVHRTDAQVTWPDKPTRTIFKKPRKGGAR
jgi:hypothetical protein